jgi:hypothetical protein
MRQWFLNGLLMFPLGMATGCHWWTGQVCFLLVLGLVLPVHAAGGIESSPEQRYELQVERGRRGLPRPVRAMPRGKG